MFQNQSIHFKLNFLMRLLNSQNYWQKNAHDNWALQRINEGWTYGSARNDNTKKHPCLVPYEDLPDSEKEYDRKAAMETLKAIVALGYRITKDSICRQ